MATTRAMTSNKAIAANYYKKLKALTERMTEETTRNILSVYRKNDEQIIMDAGISGQSYAEIEDLSKEWETRYGQPNLYNKMVDDTDKYVNFIVLGSIATLYGINRAEKTKEEEALEKVYNQKKKILKKPSVARKQTLEALQKSQKALLISVPQQYFTKISTVVFKNISNGMPLEELKADVQRINEQTARRVKNIAADQTSKAHSALIARTAEKLGINQFEWEYTYRSKTSRPFHKAKYPKGLNGGIFDINNPPVADLKTGERALPGVMINCKCKMRLKVEL